MSSAHWYELRLKKGETLIELTADDPDFMDGQLRHWFDMLSVPGVPSYPSATMPAEPSVSSALLSPSSTETSPLAATPEPPVGLAQRREHHQGTEILPKKEEIQGAPSVEKLLPETESAVAEPVSLPASDLPTEKAAGFSRPESVAAAPRFVDAPVVPDADSFGDPDLDELLGLDTDKTEEPPQEAIPSSPVAQTRAATLGHAPERSAMQGDGHTELTADELLAMELDAELLDEPDIVLKKYKPETESSVTESPVSDALVKDLDEEAAQVLDELMATSPVSGDLPTNEDARAMRSSSMSDRHRDPDGDDEDFERVMSTLMADLQGSPVEDDDTDSVAYEDVAEVELDEEDLPPAAWAEQAPTEMAESVHRPSQPMWSAQQNELPEGDEDISPTDWDQIDLPLGTPVDEDDAGLHPQSTRTAGSSLEAEEDLEHRENASRSPWAPVNESTSFPDKPDHIGNKVSEALTDEPAGREEVSPTVTSADVAPPTDEAAREPSHEIFIRVCDTTGAATSEDHLLISAYVLTVKAQQERFSLGALNQVITQAGESAVNHSILEVALNKGLLMMVPDLTGTAETAEFELTPHGRATVDTFL